jgi:dUTP pyrophosphatase
VRFPAKEVVVGLNVKRLDPNAILPTVAHSGDLGFDLYALENTTIAPFAVTKVRTGIAAQYVHPEAEFGLLVRDRSSVALGGIFVVGGVIDAGYTGEIVVLVRSFGNVLIDIKAGQRIAQILPLEVFTEEGVEEVEYLKVSTRKDKGFGSTNG